MPKDSFKVTYYSDDGYVGKDRPMYVSIYESDLEEDMNEEQLIELLESCVQESFEQKVSPYTSGSEQEDFLGWAKDIIALRLEAKGE